MEENKKCEQIGLIGELMQGKELAKQLCDHLFSPSSSSSPPPPSPSSSPTSSSSSTTTTTFNVTNEVLIEKILSSYEKALTMLNSRQTKLDSQCSNGSPKSVVEDSYFKHKEVSKKRKTMSRWAEQIKVYSGTSLEGSLSDGYSWRKYGQKDILGARFPRGYYRCTHRTAQGCLATKQVQKSDEDPMMYEITYKGRHTCTHATHLNKAIPSKTKLPSLGENKPQTHQKKNQPQEQKAQPQQEKILSFGSELEIKIEDLDNKEDIFPSFNFASPSIGSENEEDNNIFFSNTMVENNFMESFSPSEFLSPTTSESDFFSFSPCHFESTGLGPNVPTSESDITGRVSDPNSVPNSPIDLDIFFRDMDFDMDFPMNTPEL